MEQKENMDKFETILAESSNRFVLFPIRYNGVWQMYKKALSAFWTAEEIDLSKDIDDWNKLNDNERHFIKNVLAFFAGSDGIVNENLGVRFMNEVQIPEAKCFYGFQIAMENVHCVSGDTMILTDTGYKRIDTIVQQNIKVWNGEKWSPSMVVETGDSDGYYVTLTNGLKLACTPNHEWLISDTSERIKAKELKVGDVLSRFRYPTVLPGIKFDKDMFNNAYDHGKTCVDEATYNPTKHSCRPNMYVPFNYTNEVKIDWLNGLLSVEYPIVKHPNKEDLQLLLSTLGIHSSVNDGVMTLFAPESEIPGLMLPKNLEPPPEVRIDTITPIEQKMKTYCFEEPDSHTGIFNGILTGQSETYSLLLDTYIKNGDEKNHLLNAINTIPCIAKKAQWAMRWIYDKDTSFAKRLVAFAAVEGIFFSGAFCAIFWLKERGIMPGLCSSNEFISRDESLHTEFAIHLYTLLDNKMKEEEVLNIIKEAVEIEDEFINESIPCNLLGMNGELMSQYIKFVADRLLVQLGYSTYYNVSNPFHFMERISLNNKSNFFEHTRVSEYAKARIGDKPEDNQFSLDADF